MTGPASLTVVGDYGSLRFALDGLGAEGFSIVSIRAMNQFTIRIAPAIATMVSIMQCRSGAR